MEIIYKPGDMLTGGQQIIVHGCNAQGVMNSGVAKAIRAAYPGAFDVYREKFEKSGLHLGDVIPYASKDRVVLNAITQRYYGRDPHIQYVSYDAVRDAMRAINAAIAPNEIAMPLIGAGFGNGHWPTIAEIIEAELTDVQPIVYLLDGAIPT